MITPGEEVFTCDHAVEGASEMEISISVQECWDGVNLDSPDHKSHVAFRLGEAEDAPCPATHSEKIAPLGLLFQVVQHSDSYVAILL